MNKETLNAIRALSNIEWYLRKENWYVTEWVSEQIDIVMYYLYRPYLKNLLSYLRLILHLHGDF